MDLRTYDLLMHITFRGKKSKLDPITENLFSMHLALFSPEEESILRSGCSSEFGPFEAV